MKYVCLIYYYLAKKTFWAKCVACEKKIVGPDNILNNLITAAKQKVTN